MGLNDIYESNSQWLKADDIKGQKPIVTIESATIKENDFNGEKKKQIVLAFVGKQKQLGLNFTNAQKIADLTDTGHLDTEDMLQAWEGLTIKLHVEKVKFQNGMVDAIRIFPELPGDAAEPPKAKAKGNTPQFTGGSVDPEEIPF